jgi:hypothetical protein
MSKLHAVLVAAVAAFAFGSSPAQASIVDSTFSFTGTCNTDCTGTAHATLVLSGYTLGDQITTNNFVSLTYQSDFLSFSVTTPAELTFIETGSSIKLPLPGAELVRLGFAIPGSTNRAFGTFANGTWCAGNLPACDDAGGSGVWAATPLPAALPLFATGIGGLGLLGWRRKRKAQVVA